MDDTHDTVWFTYGHNRRTDSFECKLWPDGMVLGTFRSKELAAEYCQMKTNQHTEESANERLVVSAEEKLAVEVKWLKVQVEWLLKQAAKEALGG